MMSPGSGDITMTSSGSDRPPGGRAQDSSDRLGTRESVSGGGQMPLADLSHSMLARLSRTIETELVPRFMLALEPNVARSEERPSETLTEQVEDFVGLVLRHDAAVASRQVAALRSQGFALADIYLQLLSPAARRLGEMWEEDVVGFSDVAVGMCRMHQVLLDFSRCFDPADTHSAAGLNALVIPVAGEEHTFGLFMVVEFLRRAGWHCWTGSPTSVSEIKALVQENSFDAVLVSLSAERHMAVAGDTINEVRKHSKNRNTVVLLGGRAANDNPQLVAQLGADGTAKDGRGAVQILRELTGVDSRTMRED